MPKISLENLSFAYKKGKTLTPVFDDLNIVFSANQINVILGESGCGKSTLLKCISGLINYKGNIKFDDNIINNLPVQERNVGYMTQNFSMYPHMTLFDSIAFPLKMNKVHINEIRQRVYKIAEIFDIVEVLSRKPRQVSIGQLQRAALSRALIKNPTICLFDEPLSNLDEINRANFRQYLKNYLSENIVTVVYVTHNLEEATSLGNVIHILKDGRFIFSGSSDDLLSSKDEYIKEFLSSLRKNKDE